jgi:saccharopine dehydrogenase-like NADP-dependent oxidoreductase
MRVVVLGGYGNFGARICRALAGNPGVELVVATRQLDKARAFADGLGVDAAALDAAKPDLARQLRSLGAGLVLHTAGPFQGQDYAVAQAAADAGCHYIDLADGRRFVCDFESSVGAAFRQAGKFATSGASTLPALSSAVIDSVLPRFARLDAIDLCIAPAQQAPRGVATLAAVLSYCGEPIEVWRDGRWTTRYGWAAPAPVAFVRMRTRLGALCDVPDLELLPRRYSSVRDVMFRAALEVPLGQRMFASLAWLRRAGLMRRPAAMASWLNTAGTWFDGWGTDLGGMVVRIRGRGIDGKSLHLAWHITAGQNHGPEIPCMAAILLARRLARGDAFPHGAFPCMGWLTLDEFMPEFARWGMVTELIEESAGS